MEKTNSAHIRVAADGEHCQALLTHNRNTAAYSAAALSAVSLASAGYLAGLVHDMGKATEAFQNYLCDAAHGKKVKRGSVNHTFAAVRYLLNRYHDAEKWGAYAPLTAELLAYAAGAHHGLFDCVDGQHRSGFQHRLDKQEIGYEEAYSGFFAECAQEEPDRLFVKATEEVEAFVSRLLANMGEAPDLDESLFQIGLLSRMLLSGVIEGDRRDTAEFMGNIHFPLTKTRQEQAALWKKLSTEVDARVDSLPQDTPIQKARRSISLQCRDFANQPGGIYRLNVPTGAGKTLSSLRFALAHAAKWEKKRIIFTSPLLSILDQNADVIREYIADDSLILEHHSNVIRPHEDGDELNISEFLLATWDAPVIITTFVQLLNTLFDGSVGCIRRFHSLCDSVIVIDEVQTVPGKLLSLFNLAVGFLAGACGVTVVLCSATQPCLEAAEHPILGSIRDMVPYDSELWSAFRRTRIVNAGSRSLADMPALIEETLRDADSLLVVCNKKSEAETLLRTLPKKEYLTFHLSAAMCMAHRKKTLSDLQTALKSPPPGVKIVCVSTQVIEAGVDISFARVIRLTAGMDSIVQSAGRCNRNGESAEPVPVRIVQCVGEGLRHLPDIRRAKSATLELLEAFRLNPAHFDDALTSDESIAYYYRQLFQKEMPHGLQDGAVKAGGTETTLFALLSENRDFTDPAFETAFAHFSLRQAFKTAGQLFTVFDSDTTEVLVPYGEGRKLIAELSTLQLPKDFDRLQALIQQAKAYTVSLYGWQKRKLEQENALISFCDDSILVLQEGYYDEATGLGTEQGAMEYWEV